MEKEPSTKFYGILKFWSWAVSDIIPTNVHNMLFSAVYTILRQELIWFRSPENTFFCFSWFFFCVCFLHSWYMLGNLIYDEQKSQVVRRFTAVTQLEKTPDKISYFPFPNPKTWRERAEIWLKNIRTRYNITNFKFLKDDVVCSPYFHKSCFQINME